MIETISYTIRKRILYIAFMSILFITTCYQFMPKQYVIAATPVEDGEEEESTSEGDRAQKTADNIVSMFVSNCNLVYVVCQTGTLVKDTIEKFKLTSEIRSASRKATNIESMAVTIAIGLAYIYILLYILREAMRGEMTMEFWGKCFIILMVTCIAASQWFVILNSVDKLGDYVLTKASEAFQGQSENDRTTELMQNNSASPVKMMVNQGVLNIQESDLQNTTITDANGKKTGVNISSPWAQSVVAYWWGSPTASPTDVIQGNTEEFKRLLSENYETVVTDSSYSQLNLSGILNLIIRVLLIGMKCAIDAQLFFIALQLVLRGAFMPIAIVGVASEGMRGGAIRYIKRYFALYIQEAVIIVIMVAFTTILFTILDPSKVAGSIVEIYYVLTCYGAITATITQSSAVAQEIIGD